MSDLTDENLKYLEDIGFVAALILFTQRNVSVWRLTIRRKKIRAVCFLGCRVPVELRERMERGYELVGEVYVHGILKGGAMTEENMERLEGFYTH